MLRIVPRRLAIGSFSMFMIEQKNHPKLQGLAIADRGKMTSKLYKTLSPSEKAALEKRAANYVSKKPRKVKAQATGIDGAPTAKKAKVTRAPSAYAMFVKSNIHKFDKLPHRDRMSAVAKLWKQQKQRSGH